MTPLIPLSAEEKQRYARHLSLEEIGLAGQQKLKAARVLVIGAGGLGCPLLQYLTAAGVGCIGIVDDDLVEESNLQRQILFNPDDIGKPKAEIAREKLMRQNPHVHLQAHVLRLNAGNALQVMADYDLVVDGSDNFATRYLVNDACVMGGKVLVFGSIFRFQGQVSVFNYQGGPTYRCLYPEPGTLAACTEAGVLGVLPGLVGCLMANEVLKVLTGAGQVLSGRLLVLDALTMEFNSFFFKPDLEHKHIRSLPAGDSYCQASFQEIGAGDLVDLLQKGQGFTLLDVREEAEYAAGHLNGLLLPLGLLDQKLDEIPGGFPLVVYCQSGGRSRQAAARLVARGMGPVYNLKGGLAAMSLAEQETLRQLVLRNQYH
ncbi:MAG: molybdopterin-synthase adenylyltransferase MoeB [Adhaeribacter sp.]